MHIKRLELLGFKSFASRTGIAFARGVCAVVGPNGCGKSNVVDAIRWVLGEASAHELRGHRMHDVIFAGSRDRAPVNMAEVNMILDNEAGLAPEPYRQMPEIMVTRRLFRSGESDYFINRNPVRRLDIQLLFMDTGLGQGGYAIIEQGKISQVVEARPEELRELLEEAAGIMRFKTRKKIAVKKMELTRQNLDRIQDLCHEVNRQTRRLATEAQRAHRHRTLRDRARRLELQLALQEYESLRLRLETLTAQLQTVRAELEVGNREWREWQSHWTRFESSWQDLQEQQARHRQQIQQLENQQNLARRDQSHLATQAQQASQRLEQEQQQQRTFQEQLSRWEQESHGLAAETDRLAQAIEHRSLRITTLDQTLAAARSERRQLGIDVDELKADTVEVMSRKAQAHNAVLAARRQIEELSRRSVRRGQEAAELTPKLEAGNLEIAGLEEQLTHLRKHSTALKESETHLRQETRDTRGNLQNLHKEWQRRDTQYRKQHSRLEALQELEERYEWYDQDVRKLLTGPCRADGRRASVEVLARFIDVNPESVQAAEAVFGDLLQALVAGSLEELQNLMHELKQHQGARAQFLPLPFWHRADTPGGLSCPSSNGHRALLEEVKAAEQVQPLLQSLLSRVFLVEDWTAALDHWVESPFRYTFVTLDGDCLFADGRVLARSPLPAQSLLHKRLEISELERHCTELRVRSETQENLVNAARQRLEELEQDLSRVEQEVRDHETRLSKTEHACLHLQTERRKWLDKLELLNAEEQRDDDERLFHRESLETNETFLETLSLAEAEHQHRLRELNSKLDELRAHLETSEKDYLQAKIMLSQDQERHAQALKEQERLSGLMADAGQRLATCEGRHRQNEESIRQWRDREAALQQQLLALEQNLRAHREQIEHLTERQRELKHRQTKLEHQRDELKGVYRTRQRHEQQWQNDLTEASLQMDFLRRRILEHHRVQLDQWQSDGELEALPQEELSKQLEDARQRLEKLGEARYSAIEEYEEQKQRLDFLESQRQDLEKTIEDLQHTIQQIQRTSRKHFLETLAAVDARLGEVFPVLLGGGSARLQLLDAEHPLESGVELLVKLPGKRTAAMSLLSGGEKALTALALLFAISMTRPSPFLLLDEVDAPLDEVNVGRFCDLLRKLQQKSQVIMISHNQRTMEIAHQLIGVTMDEPGVSRVIPLDLAQRS